MDIYTYSSKLEKIKAVRLGLLLLLLLLCCIFIPSYFFLV